MYRRRFQSDRFCQKVRCCLKIHKHNYRNDNHQYGFVDIHGVFLKRNITHHSYVKYNIADKREYEISFRFYRQ